MTRVAPASTNTATPATYSITVPMPPVMAGWSLLVHDGGGDNTGGRIARSRIDLERDQLRISSINFMLCSDFEELSRCGVVACRSVGFHELVLAVVDALVGGGVLAVHALDDGHFAEISGIVFLSLVILVELELRQVILSGLPLFAEGLGDVQLVGEHDDLSVGVSPVSPSPPTFGLLENSREASFGLPVEPITA